MESLTKTIEAGTFLVLTGNTIKTWKRTIYDIRDDGKLHFQFDKAGELTMISRDLKKYYIYCELIEYVDNLHQKDSDKESKFKKFRELISKLNYTKQGKVRNSPRSEVLSPGKSGLEKDCNISSSTRQLPFITTDQDNSITVLNLALRLKFCTLTSSKPPKPSVNDSNKNCDNSAFTSLPRDSFRLPQAINTDNTRNLSDRSPSQDKKTSNFKTKVTTQLFGSNDNQITKDGTFATAAILPDYIQKVVDMSDPSYDIICMFPPVDVYEYLSTRLAALQSHPNINNSPNLSSTTAAAANSSNSIGTIGSNSQYENMSKIMECDNSTEHITNKQTIDFLIALDAVCTQTNATQLLVDLRAYDDDLLACYRAHLKAKNMLRDASKKIQLSASYTLISILWVCWTFYISFRPTVSTLVLFCGCTCGLVNLYRYLKAGGELLDLLSLLISLLSPLKEDNLKHNPFASRDESSRKSKVNKDEISSKIVMQLEKLDQIRDEYKRTL